MLLAVYEETAQNWFWGTSSCTECCCLWSLFNVRIRCFSKLNRFNMVSPSLTNLHLWSFMQLNFT